ncbi:MAG: DEAD/DEAH box helicase [Clostridiales bacterium]|nr:DEAD/DEAH box helicase [Clostridiales bacterium]
MLQLASNADVYARGEAYYQGGRVLSFTQSQNGLSLSAGVEGNYRNYTVNIDFDESGQIERYKCNCSAHSIWRGACKHVIAALFALLDAKNTATHELRAGRFAKELTETLEKRIFEQIDHSLLTDEMAPDAEPVRVEPKLYIENSSLYVSFTIGVKRMYVIKNINEFVSNVKSQQTASYGKFSFRHASSVFDPNCRDLVNFLVKEVTLINDVSQQSSHNYYSYYSAREQTRRFDLTSRNTDEFFSIFINKELEISSTVSATSMARVLDEQPPITFAIEHLPNEIRLLGEKREFRQFTGAKFKYILLTPFIYRVEMDKGEALTMILQYLDKANTPYLSFVGEHRMRFGQVILPFLTRVGLIREVKGEEEMYVSDSMVTRLYFDADEKDVVCEVKFCYGTVEINPLRASTAPVLRDLPEEYRVTRQLLLYGFVPDNKRSLYVMTGDETVYRFITGGMNGIRNAEIFVTDELERKKTHPLSAKLGLRISGNMLALTIEQSEFSFSDLMEAIESMKAKRKFHRLKDGRFIDLADEQVREMSELIDSLDLSKKEIHGGKALLPKYRALYLDKLTEEKVDTERDTEFEKLSSDFKHYKDLDFEVPPELNNVLREYQKTGYCWMRVLSYYGFGGILADDMGLGKTIQVIAFITATIADEQKNLVVCPTSLLYNWENEIARFAPKLTTQVISGLAEKRREQLRQPADVYITTYDMLKRDIDNYASIKFETIVADEAQNIKNPLTQNAKSVKEIKAKNRFALTGTPIENSLTELWSIFDFIMPGYLHTSHKFTKLYETPIIKNGDSERSSALRKQISPFLLRRLKKDVLTELPEKSETTLYAELLPEQKKLYLAQLLKARGDLEDPRGGSFAQKRMRILADLTQLRQICCHPGLFVDGYQEGSGKLNLALETIQMTVESGHRLLMFSQFTSMLSILRKMLDALGFNYFYLDGSTPSKDRMDMAQRFNDGENELFLISLKAGGAGLNLVGADVVIHYDMWWNPAVMDQASDRAHRFGQKNSVQVFNLVAKDTVEEKILELHGKKKNLVDSVITEGEQFINTMSEEEVRELFRV